MKKTISRVLATAGAAGGVVLLAAGVASAHVSVAAPGAEQGGYSVLTFRVPTESDTAGTTAVTVQLPNLTSARTEPLPGWTSTVVKDETSKTATAVTWTADPGVSVGPGQFQQFVLSAGPLPEREQVEFPATQTYSDGTVVQWNQQPGPDGSEPDKPAPSLALAAESTTTDAATATSVSTDTTARWLGGIGLVLGALGAALGLGATMRSRRS
ncbi:YcnI family protein [Prescottella subtropica]|uniref:YcnI family copper-binding membrane protein n=1 Tax=Prescottella subtropica TaxID=2545757 RepID=UPI0010F75EED|nr:YcnI family protein [Prescottella subtropica]